MTDAAILAVYAHPDDEQGVSGTLAKYARDGVRVGLICATRGEVGEISDPALATPENLGAVRERELRDAAAVLGVQQTLVPATTATRAWWAQRRTATPGPS